MFRGVDTPSKDSKKRARVPGTPFKRIDVEEALKTVTDSRLLDNTYTGAFGAAGWGAKASNTLLQVRGKDFRHEKTKKKRGTYTGGAIDGAVNSIKLGGDDSDD